MVSRESLGLLMCSILLPNYCNSAVFEGNETSFSLSQSMTWMLPRSDFAYYGVPSVLISEIVRDVPGFDGDCLYFVSASTALLG